MWGVMFMDDGLLLAAQYSYITNCLGYCGPQEGSKYFLGYLKKPEDMDENAKLVMQYL